MIIVGHTDNQGSFELNTELSEKRAQSVAAALAKDHGVEPKRMTPKGAGMMAPVASNRDESGCAKNRRVEIVER